METLLVEYAELIPKKSCAHAENIKFLLAVRMSEIPNDYVKKKTFSVEINRITSMIPSEKL